MTLYGPRRGAAAADDRRVTAPAIIGVLRPGTGDALRPGAVGPRAPMHRPLDSLRRPRVLTPRETLQVATAGAMRPAGRVPWTPQDERNHFRVRKAVTQRGRGPKSYNVAVAGTYSPAPDAARAPGGVTGAIARVATAVSSAIKGPAADKSCVDCA